MIKIEVGPGREFKSLTKALEANEGDDYSFVLDEGFYSDGNIQISSRNNIRISSAGDAVWQDIRSDLIVISKSTQIKVSGLVFLVLEDISQRTCGIDIQYCSHVKIEECYFNGSGNGIIVSDSTDIGIENNVIRVNHSGISFERGSGVIRRNTFLENDVSVKAQISILSIESNVIAESRTDGFQFESGPFGINTEPKQPNVYFNNADKVVDSRWDRMIVQGFDGFVDPNRADFRLKGLPRDNSFGAPWSVLEKIYGQPFSDVPTLETGSPEMEAENASTIKRLYAFTNTSKKDNRFQKMIDKVCEDLEVEQVEKLDPGNPPDLLIFVQAFDEQESSLALQSRLADAVGDGVPYVIFLVGEDYPLSVREINRERHESITRTHEMLTIEYAKHLVIIQPTSPKQALP